MKEVDIFMTEIARYPIRVGVQLHPQHVTYQEYIDVVRRFDGMGVDSIFNWDHFFPLSGNPQGNHFEGWTLLSAMAALTQHAQIGCLVTCNTYRNPALLADMAKTVDHISNGRLILGLGAGWFERDYSEYGYDFGTAGSRLTALESSLPIILHRWEADVPRPVRYPLPILIGGGGEKKTLRIAAQYATIWHGYGDLTTLTHKIEVLKQWCKEVGRNPREIEYSTAAPHGANEQILGALVAAGITHFVQGIGAPWDFKGIERMLRWRDQQR